MKYNDTTKAGAAAPAFCYNDINETPTEMKPGYSKFL